MPEHCRICKGCWREYANLVTERIRMEADISSLQPLGNYKAANALHIRICELSPKVVRARRSLDEHLLMHHATGSDPALQPSVALAA
jgi:hypothetical protein